MNRNERMNALVNNGIATDGFFDVNLRVPVGYSFEVLVNGEHVDVSRLMVNNDTAPITPIVTDGNGASVSNVLDNDYITSLTTEIFDNGYVKNNRLWRRFVMAQTFRMLNADGGWDGALRSYPYSYQFKMLIDELHVQTKLANSSEEDFKERNQFFNKDVVVALCDQYLYQLKKYINGDRSTKRNKYRNRMVVLSKYGNVRLADLQSKVYTPIENQIANIERCENPYRLEMELKKFFKDFYNKIPDDTTKCVQWRHAFMASGAYYSLKNMIMFHDIVFFGCNGIKDSMELLDRKAKEYSGDDGWKLHMYLKKVIEDNDFDFAKSIEAHK